MKVRTLYLYVLMAFPCRRETVSFLFIHFLACAVVTAAAATTTTTTTTTTTFEVLESYRGFEVKVWSVVLSPVFSYQSVSTEVMLYFSRE